MPTPRLYPFGRSQRIRSSQTFRLVYAKGRMRQEGPLAIHVHPNGGTETRLGLSVSRRVGGAVVRNRIKRRLREAFRLERPTLPGGYDVVVNVRPHKPLKMAVYRTRLASALRSLDKAWKNATTSPSRDDDTPSGP